MKRILLILVLLGITLTGFGQATYYWAGGSTASSLTGTDWSTTLGGAATTSRNAADDILVFDNKTVVFDITSTTYGKLVIQNGADVTFTRSLSAGTGTSTMNLAGVAGVGLEVNNAKLRINGSTASYNFTLALVSGITGVVTNGAEVFITGTANNRISATTLGVLTFQNGTTCTVNSAVNPFNTYTSGLNDNSVFFDSGATLIFQGGLSPFGNTTTGNILRLASNSNFIFQAVHPANLFSSRIFGNVLIKSGVTINLAENFIKMNDLTIESGATFNLRSSGGHAVTGNIVVDGTLGVNGTPTSSQLIMAGTNPQTISGSGSINALGCFTVAKDANVTLSRNLVINGTSTSNVIGRLNFGTNVISGTCNFQFRSASSLTDNGGATTLGSNTIQMANTTAYNALSPTVGLLVTGAGIPANSYIIGTSSGSFNFTISNFATATASNVTITTIGEAATLSTFNTGGPDASLTTTGNGASATKSIGSGTNLILNVATNAPFATTFFSSGGTQTNISYGNVTFNAASTTNTDATINGVLTLNNAKLTIRAGDNLTMSTTSSFAGTSNSAYIVTDANTSTGTFGALRIAGLLSSRLLPLGTANHYLPVTLNPSSASNFTVNVFQGATVDATPNGAALSDKADIVDAIYNINRTSGTGDCAITLAWQAGLEGSNFSNFSDAQVGVAKYTAGAYTSFVGPGNNTANTITSTITDNIFGPFLIGKVGVLPVTLLSFNAKAFNQTVVLKWKATSEVNLSHYLVQRSIDGLSFETLTSVKANNRAGVFDYGFIDQSPLFGSNYYQLVSVDTDGKTSVSNLQVVNLGAPIILSVYPNPTHGTLNISGLTKGDIVKVVDLLGKVLNVEQSNTNVMNLNIANANSGIYSVLVLRNGKIISSNKVVKN